MDKSITLRPTRSLDLLGDFSRWLATRLAWLPLKGLLRRRIPVVRQMSAVECGAACLSMILSYYGRKTPLAECREACGVGRDGLTARIIAQAARNFGLRVKAFSADLSAFGQVPLPAVAHWNFNHFVIVERWSPKGTVIIDPASGRRSVTSEEFNASYTGVVLTFEPGVQFEQRRRVARPAWCNYLWSILCAPGASALLGQLFGASLLLQLLGLALPAFTKVIVDWVLPFQIDNAMAVLGIGLVLLVLAQATAGYLRSALLLSLQARLDWKLMLGFFEHILSLPYRFFQERASGDLLMRLGSNTVIREVLAGQTVSAVLDVGFVMGYLIVLVVWAPLYTALVLCIGLAQAGLLLSTTHRVHDLMERDLANQAESQSYLVEALTGIATLKASGAEMRAFDHWSNLYAKYLNISLQRNHLSAIIETLQTTLRIAAPLLLLWVGAHQMLKGTMSLGTMLAINALAVSVLTPLSSLVANGQRLQFVGAHLERITDVLSAKPEQDLALVRCAPALAGRIELKNVSFRYDPNAPFVLENVSLAIEPGQKIAFTGRTGSGKSTLAKLLLGLYQPTEGEILFDGLPLQRLQYPTLRSQFGVVLQEAFLFTGSIRQNISFNDPSIPLEQLIAAARLACIHDDIMRMPMKYETVISEGGSGLSGGQRQRLALARALVHKPAILLLDEATSHLDLNTEQSVEQNLNTPACTRIVIAHRQSSIRNADTILVLEEGRIIKQDWHDGPPAAAVSFLSTLTE